MSIIMWNLYKIGCVRSLPEVLMWLKWFESMKKFIFDFFFIRESSDKKRDK